jgi:hypothetical protein
MQTIFLAWFFAALRVGIRIASSSAIIAITTSSSIRVKAFFFFILLPLEKAFHAVSLY